uniref:Uncharacterized protein n=1 Tax=Anopheles albimanus TaxID=7167 RepID=A0A182F636_ANOAL
PLCTGDVYRNRSSCWVSREKLSASPPAPKNAWTIVGSSVFSKSPAMVSVRYARAGRRTRNRTTNSRNIRPADSVEGRVVKSGHETSRKASCYRRHRARQERGKNGAMLGTKINDKSMTFRGGNPQSGHR